jgi:uncharacterized membrane protein
MLSNHYPLAFGTAYNWIIGAGLPDGRNHPPLVQHHPCPQGQRPTWTWLVTVILFIVIMWLSTVPKILSGEKDADIVAPRRSSSLRRTRISPQQRRLFRPAVRCVTLQSPSMKASRGHQRA